MAEDTPDLIHELTLWLLDEACRQLAAWRAAGRDVPYVAVNLSGRSFHRPGLPGDQRRTATPWPARQRCAAGDHQSVMMDARPVTLQNIEALHHQGFKLSLDDFGTGYFSLSYLHRLPISELKLDMALCRTSPPAPRRAPSRCRC